MNVQTIRKMKKIWCLIKENYKIIIALTTVFITMVYALLKLIIYVFWSGYFRELDIDKSLMNLNFDGYVLNSIYFAIVFAVIIFMMIIVYIENDNIIYYIKEKDMRLVGKCKMVIKIFLKNFIRTFCWLFMSNIPLAITICVLTHEEIKNFWAFSILLFFLESMELISIRLNADDSSKGNKSLEDKISNLIFMTVVLSSAFIAVVYMLGSKAVTNKNNIQLVNGTDYAITYCDGNSFVLHKVDVKDKRIIIYRSQQKIIDAKNCEYSVVGVEEVVVDD